MTTPPLSTWLALLLVSLCGLCARHSIAAEAPPDIQWHEVTPDKIEGQGWTDVKSPFDRLPARAEQLVRPPVWEISRHSAGLTVRFETMAPSIWVRWTLTSERLAMPHMPATGVSGVDLYVRKDGRWYFAGVGIPKKFPVNEVEITGGLEGIAAEYRLYLPLYNGVSRVELGVPKGATFEFLPPSTHPPIVLYGTSITQGGCASRPGMSYAAILSRALDVPVINLGFSGNGAAEPEVARLLAELEPAAYVLDPLGNLFTEQVASRLPEFIDILRERHADVPILLHENVYYPTTQLVAARLRRVEASNSVLHRILEEKLANGDANISIIPACDLTGEDGNLTVDGTHPTDLGFVRMADSLEPFWQKVVSGEN